MILFKNFFYKVFFKVIVILLIYVVKFGYWWNFMGFFLF